MSQTKLDAVLALGHAAPERAVAGGLRLAGNIAAVGLLQATEVALVGGLGVVPVDCVVAAAEAVDQDAVPVLRAVEPRLVQGAASIVGRGLLGAERQERRCGDA